MRYFLAFLAFVLCGAQSMPFPGPGTPAAPPFVYSGPLNAVAGADFCIALRACSQAAATSLAAAVNVWRASDSTTTDIHVTNHGDLDTTAAAAFAGTDATATCTMSGTSVPCTGASSTPHVGDPVSGAGITQPCTATAVGTFTGGAGTVTASNPLTGGSCGTVGAGETMTFQVMLRAPMLYDQTGGTHNFDASSGGTSSANSPQLILKCLGTSATLPCIQFFPVSAAGYGYVTTLGVTWPGATGTISGVTARTANPTFYVRIIAATAGSAFGSLFNATANSRILYQGNLSGTAVTATASDNAFHSAQYIMNTTSSHIDIDNVVGTAGDSGSTALPSGNMSLGDANTHQAFLWTEALVYTGVVFTSGQSTAMTNNQRSYWGF